MTRFTVTQRAGEDTVFAPTAWDHLVGRIVPLRFPGGGSVPITLVSAVVSEDGKVAVLTFETHEKPIVRLPPNLSKMSVGFHVEP